MPRTLLATVHPAHAHPQGRTSVGTTRNRSVHGSRRACMDHDARIARSSNAFKLIGRLASCKALSTIILLAVGLTPLLIKCWVISSEVIIVVVLQRIYIYNNVFAL